MTNQSLYKTKSFDPETVSGLKYTSPDYLVDLYKSKMKNVNSDLNVSPKLEDNTISYELINKRLNKANKKQPEIENDPKLLLNKESFDIDLNNEYSNNNIKINDDDSKFSRNKKYILNSISNSRNEILDSLKLIIDSKELLKIIIFILIMLLFYSMLKCQIYKYKLKMIKKQKKKK